MHVTASACRSHCASSKGTCMWLNWTNWKYNSFHFLRCHHHYRFLSAHCCACWLVIWISNHISELNPTQQKYKIESNAEDLWIHIYIIMMILFLSETRRWHTRRKNRNRKTEWKTIQYCKGFRKNNKIRKFSLVVCLIRRFAYTRELDSFYQTESTPSNKTRPSKSGDIDQRVIFKIRSFMDADPFA